MALNGLFCADVLLRNYSLTHSLTLVIGYVYVKPLLECILSEYTVQTYPAPDNGLTCSVNTQYT